MAVVERVLLRTERGRIPRSCEYPRSIITVGRFLRCWLGLRLVLVACDGSTSDSIWRQEQAGVIAPQARVRNLRKAEVLFLVREDHARKSQSKDHSYMYMGDVACSSLRVCQRANYKIVTRRVICSIVA